MAYPALSEWFDRAVLTWIALVDTVGCFFMWKMLQHRQKERIKRIVNKLMRRLSLTFSASR